MKATLLRMTLGLAGLLWLHGTSLAQDTDDITTTFALGAAYTTGSYGTDSTGTERVSSASPCRPTQDTAVCF